MRTLAISLLTALFLPFFSSCEKDDKKEKNESDSAVQPTQMRLTFVDPENKVSIVAFQDVDGPGGNDPIKDDIVLEVGKSYNLSILLLKDGEKVDEDLTMDVVNEDINYLLCTDHNLPLNITTNDFDSRGFPVGLESSWLAQDAKSGQLTFNLMYYDPDTKNGLCETPGELAFTATFNIALN